MIYALESKQKKFIAKKILECAEFGNAKELYVGI